MPDHLHSRIVVGRELARPFTGSIISVGSYYDLVRPRTLPKVIRYFGESRANDLRLVVGRKKSD